MQAVEDAVLQAFADNAAANGRMFANGVQQGCQILFFRFSATQQAAFQCGSNAGIAKVRAKQPLAINFGKFFPFESYGGKQPVHILAYGFIFSRQPLQFGIDMPFFCLKGCRVIFGGDFLFQRFCRAGNVKAGVVFPVLIVCLVKFIAEFLQLLLVKQRLDFEGKTLFLRMRSRHIISAGNRSAGSSRNGNLLIIFVQIFHNEAVEKDFPFFAKNRRKNGKQAGFEHIGTIQPCSILFGLELFGGNGSFQRFQTLKAFFYFAGVFGMPGFQDDNLLRFRFLFGEELQGSFFVGKPEQILIFLYIRKFFKSDGVSFEVFIGSNIVLINHSHFAYKIIFITLIIA